VGTLYLIATPIGNLEDISPRALRILNEVDLIAAEDTRRTRKLLTYFDIHTPLTSYFEHNKLIKLEEVKYILIDGNVALVSDAGTPVINDPGYELVLAVIEAGHDVSPVPGPCAPIAALTASGLPADKFLYLGYLPRKSSQRKLTIEGVMSLPYSLVFLETPHRLRAALSELNIILGNRRVAVARELTKLHEEIYRGKLADALQYFSAHTPRGEFTIVVAGKETSEESWSDERLTSEIENYLKRDESPSSIASILAASTGMPRRELYNLIISVKDSSS